MHAKSPESRTNLFAYVPMALLGVGLVAWVFGSGFARGSLYGKYNPAPPAPPKKAARKPVDLRKLLEPTPDLVARGQELYAINCASCHGADGQGNGEKGLGLNPPPRNYHQASSSWKYGSSVLAIYNTLTNGSPGSSMSAYKILPEEDRMALAHYVRHWVPDPQDNKPEQVAALPAPGASAAAADVPFEAPPDDHAKIPIELAMMKTTTPASRAPVARKRPAAGPGSALYTQHCASCHGLAGEGGKAVRLLTTNPYVRLRTSSLVGSKAAWTTDADAFSRLVIEGLPGRIMPGTAVLSKSEMKDLHDYVRQLAAERE